MINFPNSVIWLISTKRTWELKRQRSKIGGISAFGFYLFLNLLGSLFLVSSTKWSSVNWDIFARTIETYWDSSGSSLSFLAEQGFHGFDLLYLTVFCGFFALNPWLVHAVGRSSNPTVQARKRPEWNLRSMVPFLTLKRYILAVLASTRMVFTALPRIDEGERDWWC